MVRLNTAALRRRLDPSLILGICIHFTSLLFILREAGDAGLKLGILESRRDLNIFAFWRILGNDLVKNSCY
jgi:hypothetical protein